MRQAEAWRMAPSRSNKLRRAEAAYKNEGQPKPLAQRSAIGEQQGPGPERGLTATEPTRAVSR